MPTSVQKPAVAPERWSIDGHDNAVASLHIPADIARERRFEIACAMTVKVPADDAAGAASCWHEMSVVANGAQQWRRRVPSHNPGAYDGLDYRFTRQLPVGQALRISVTVQTRGAQRRSLVIEAEEL
jgi:hypothetical protein